MSPRLTRSSDRSVQASEKVYTDMTVTVTNRGGHSSVPRADNAIVSLK